MKRKTPEFEFKKETAHFILECYEYYLKEKEDFEIQDKLDFFGRDVSKAQAELLYSHDGKPLFKAIFIVSILLKITFKLFTWIYPNKTEYDFWVYSVKTSGNNIFKYSYDCLCDLIYKTLDGKDIVKIHTKYGESVYSGFDAMCEHIEGI